LQKSILKVAKQVNNLAINIKKTGLKLKEIFPNDTNIDNFINTCQHILDGHINWYMLCQRYGDIKFSLQKVIFIEDKTY